MGVGAIIGGVGAIAGAGAQMYAADKASGGGNIYPERDARHWMTAYLQQMTPQYDLERLFQPGYAGIARDVTGDMLFGTPETQSQRRVLRNVKGRPTWMNVWVKEPAREGMLSMMKRAQKPLEKMYYDSALRNEQFQMGRAGRYRDWLGEIDPEGMAMDKELSQQALAELRMGGKLTPAEQREVEQYVRAGQSARGMGLGPVDVFQEAMELGSAGERRKEGRRRFAMDVASRRPNPLSVLYGQLPTGGSPTAGLAASAVGGAFDMQRATGPRLVDPFRTPGVQNTNNAGANIAAAAGAGLMSLGGNLAMQSMYNRNQPPAEGAVRGYQNDWYVPAQGNAGTYYRAY